jgi:hypothetical protein
LKVQNLTSDRGYLGQVDVFVASCRFGLFRRISLFAADMGSAFRAAAGLPATQPVATTKEFTA